MKKLLSLLLIIALLCLSTFSCFAYDREDHDKLMEKILFGEANFESGKDEKIVNGLKALKDASYLSIDQYNKAGGSELESLKKLKVRGLPKNIDAFDFSGNYSHRSYTHRGWDFDYPVEEGKKTDKANWKVRKDILLSTVNTVFDFGFFSNKTFGYDEQCNSLCALIYYAHVLGDHLSDIENVKDKDDEESYTIKDMKIGVGGRNDKYSIIEELLMHFEILFQDQKDSYKYYALVSEMKSIDADIKALYSLGGDINTVGKYRQYNAYAEELADTLINYVPQLLREEAFFKKVFYPDLL